MLNGYNYRLGYKTPAERDRPTRDQGLSWLTERLALEERA